MARENSVIEERSFHRVDGAEDLLGARRFTGQFYYFHGGKYVTGTWTKGAVDEPFRFTLTDGRPLKMAPGQTYVELPTYHARVRITA